MEWFGSRQFFDQRQDASQALWMDMALARRSGQELRNSYIITDSPEYAPLRRFFKAAVDALQLVFDRSLVTSVQPRSLITQMQEAVADCDDGSSDDGMMLLSLPHDIPEVTFPVDKETRDEDTPVVISRRLTPANRPLQLLEAGQQGASAPQHLPSRPAVPDLCIASSSLLSARQIISAYCGGDCVVAGGGSSCHTSGGKPRRSYCTSEHCRTHDIRGRPRGAPRQLRVSE